MNIGEYRCADAAPLRSETRWCAISAGSRVSVGADMESASRRPSRGD